MNSISNSEKFQTIHNQLQGMFQANQSDWKLMDAKNVKALEKKLKSAEAVLEKIQTNKKKSKHLHKVVTTMQSVCSSNSKNISFSADYYISAVNAHLTKPSDGSTNTLHILLKAASKNPKTLKTVLTHKDPTTGNILLHTAIEHNNDPSIVKICIQTLLKAAATPGIGPIVHHLLTSTSDKGDTVLESLIQKSNKYPNKDFTSSLKTLVAFAKKARSEKSIFKTDIRSTLMQTATSVSTHIPMLKLLALEDKESQKYLKQCSQQHNIQTQITEQVQSSTLSPLEATLDNFLKEASINTLANCPPLLTRVWLQSNIDSLLATPLSDSNSKTLLDALQSLTPAERHVILTPNRLCKAIETNPSIPDLICMLHQSGTLPADEFQGLMNGEPKVLEACIENNKFGRFEFISSLLYKSGIHNPIDSTLLLKLESLPNNEGDTCLNTVVQFMKPEDCQRAFSDWSVPLSQSTDTTLSFENTWKTLLGVPPQTTAILTSEQVTTDHMKTLGTLNNKELFKTGLSLFSKQEDKADILKNWIKEKPNTQSLNSLATDIDTCAIEWPQASLEASTIDVFKRILTEKLSDPKKATNMACLASILSKATSDQLETLLLSDDLKSPTLLHHAAAHNTLDQLLPLLQSRETDLKYSDTFKDSLCLPSTETGGITTPLLHLIATKKKSTTLKRTLELTDKLEITETLARLENKDGTTIRGILVDDQWAECLTHFKNKPTKKSTVSEATKTDNPEALRTTLWGTLDHAALKKELFRIGPSGHPQLLETMKSSKTFAAI